MLNKKQSIPQVCQWGMGFLDTPINKMPVKIWRYQCLNSIKKMNQIFLYLQLFCLLDFSCLSLHGGFSNKLNGSFIFLARLMVNRHIFRTSFYDRNKGVLLKSDYVFMRESLERYLVQICELDTDNHEEIDQLKLLFIKLDHHIQRMRQLEISA